MFSTLCIFVLGEQFAAVMTGGGGGGGGGGGTTERVDLP